MSDTKPLQERLKESITILKKVKEMGIHETDPAYKELSGRFSDWVKGEGWSGDIEFIRYNRKAQVNLPVKKGKYATVNLLVNR